MITLVCGEQTWTVSLERAAAILKVQKHIGGSWRLPDNYEMKDGTIVRTNKEAGRGKTSKKGDRERNLASEPVEVSHRDGTAEE